MRLPPPCIGMCLCLLIENRQKIDAVVKEEEEAESRRRSFFPPPHFFRGGRRKETVQISSTQGFPTWLPNEYFYPSEYLKAKKVNDNMNS